MAVKMEGMQRGVGVVEYELDDGVVGDDDWVYRAVN